VISSEVAKRYAAGLFQLAAEKKIIDQIAAEMMAIGEVCKKDRTLLDFLAAPQIRDQDKDEVVKTVFSGRVSKPVNQLLDLIVRKRRSQFIVEIADEFQDLVLESQGIIKTRVISAVALKDKEISELKKRLEKKTGKRIQMAYYVKPEILGGMIVHLGNQIIDKSIKYQLSLLRDRLLELKVH
jgi:F-type H+-transporting ATPase subunit delta